LSIESSKGRWDWKVDSATKKLVHQSSNPFSGKNELERIFLNGAMYFPSGWDGDDEDSLSPGLRNAFSFESNPAALTWEGKPAGVRIVNIRRNGEEIMFDVKY